MKFLRHILEQPFIFATGLAALVHSTWALGTLFAGQQPDGWHLVGWLAPALLIAFALDVGQIATSAEIRAHGLTGRRGLTFVIFAGATYYLQWLYIAHHMPALPVGEGVSDIARASVISLRDAALWIIPALLPLSTLLYTFSSEPPAGAQPALQIELEAVAVPTLEDGDTQPVALPAPDEGEATGIIARCDCGWSGEYSNSRSATMALRAHKARCELLSEHLSTNGKEDAG